MKGRFSIDKFGWKIKEMITNSIVCETRLNECKAKIKSRVKGGSAFCTILIN